MQHFSSINKSFIFSQICIIFQMNPVMHSFFSFFSFNNVKICVQVRGGEGGEKEVGVEWKSGWEEWDLQKGLRWFVSSLIQSCNEASAFVQGVIGLKWYFMWAHCYGEFQPCFHGKGNLIWPLLSHSLRHHFCYFCPDINVVFAANPSQLILQCLIFPLTSSRFICTV